MLWMLLWLLWGLVQFNCCSWWQIGIYCLHPSYFFNMVWGLLSTRSTFAYFNLFQHCAEYIFPQLRVMEWDAQELYAAWPNGRLDQKLTDARFDAQFCTFLISKRRHIQKNIKTSVCSKLNSSWTDVFIFFWMCLLFEIKKVQNWASIGR